MFQLLYLGFVSKKDTITQQKINNIVKGNCKFCNANGVKPQSFISTNDGNKRGKCGLCNNILWQV